MDSRTAWVWRAARHKGLRAALACVAAAGGLLPLIWLLAAHDAWADPTTYYVSPFGDDDNSCTAVGDACRTVQAAIDRAVGGDVIAVAQGSYTDTVGTVAQITESITLQGGWNTFFTVRDPSLYPTQLDARRGGPVVTLRGADFAPAITPTVEGFIITGGDATGVAGCIGSGAGGCGGGIFGSNAIPLIRDNVIVDNRASTVGTGYGGGIYLQDGTAQSGISGGQISDNLIVDNVGALSATGIVSGFGGGINLHAVTTTVQSNVISGNLGATGAGFGGAISVIRNDSWVYTNTISGNVASSSTLAAALGSGGGIYVWQGRAENGTSGPVVESNELRENLASIGGQGAGGGITLLDTDAVVTGNLMISNTSSLNSAEQGDGGGLFGTEGTSWTLVNNRVFGNTSSTSSSRGFGGGFQLEDAHVLVEGNRVVGNTARRTPSTVTVYGGGINLLRCTGVVRGNLLRGNVVSPRVAGNTAAGGGLSVRFGALLVDANTILENESPRFGGGMFIDVTGAVTLTNNFVAGNAGGSAAGGSGGGIRVNGSSAGATAYLLHNTLVENTLGSAGEGVYASGQLTVSMVDNIVVSHTVGIRNGSAPPTTTVNADHTLFAGNDSDTWGVVNSTNPIDGSPAFVDPAQWDYHILPGSAAADAGITTWVHHDADGEPRPGGSAVDVGADEIVIRGVELAPDSGGPGVPGQTVVYTHTLTNVGNITDTFLLTATSSQAWLSGYAPLSATLGGGRTTWVQVNLTVPPQALPGTTDTTIITVTSQTDSTILDTATDTTAVGAVHLLPELLPPSHLAVADPDQTVVFTHTLINHSNIPEAFVLGAVSPGGWTAALSPNPLLPPFASTAVVLSVTVPADALAGTIGSTVLFASASVGSDTAEDTIIVNTHYGLPELEPPVQWASGDPAQALVFTHTLTNHSNITETFTLIAFSGEGWATALSPDPLTPPFAATSVVMSITIPADALAGTTVTTTLLASGSAGSDIAQAVITVEVYRLYLPLLLRGSP